MQKDAHYYALLALARACGFKKESAKTIAHASQFVDDAKINLIYFYKPLDFLPKHDLIRGRPAFFNMATCHSYVSIKTYNYESMVNNTVALHFVPGCRGENFSKKLRCKEESPVILSILEEILQDGDLIKLGIALHAYADTFSHQGFSGILSKVNDIKNCIPHSKVYLCWQDRCIYLLKETLQKLEAITEKSKIYEKLLDKIIPAYGHGQAMTFPDYPYLKWSYAYDCSDEFSVSYQKTQIDNRQRFQRAFTRINEFLTRFLTHHTDHLDPDIKLNKRHIVETILLPTLLSPGSLQSRVQRWKRIILEQGLFDKTDRHIINYDEELWLKKAFTNYDRSNFNKRVVEGARLARDFINCEWYRFYLAVKWYKQKFFQTCRDNLLDIPN